MIELSSEICADFSTSLEREWLETNGIGGYASSTVSGANSRRYHGLLVAATDPPLGRMVLLSKFEETLIVDGVRFDLSTNQYPGTVHPDGYRYMTGFRLDPFPVWTYYINGIELERSVFMLNGENTTVCRWHISDGKGKAECTLEVRPMLAFRDHHHLRREDADFNGEYEINKQVVSFTPYPTLPTLYLTNNSDSIEPSNEWYRDFEYAIEKERGFDYTEDLFQPCSLCFELDEDAFVVASTEAAVRTDIERLRTAEIDRRIDLIAAAGSTSETEAQLVLAADQFIVDRRNGKTVIAGYHWFSDWGRDTMIALNGLTLATGRPEVAKSILVEFSQYISEGMLPNRFPDAGSEPDYNTVDATLWYFEAIRAYVAATDDYDLIRDELYEKLVDIIDRHVKGTRFGIHVDSDGLLYAGEEGVQLTWMDAKIGDRVITPRTGKAVEIQALWYNALRIMGNFATHFGQAEAQAKYFEMAEIAKDSFNGQFWNDEAKCLYDVIDGAVKDASVRPNQVFSISLQNPILDPARWAAVLEKVEGELLTPYGLRSLSPNDPRYVPIYIGSPMDRDSAYHQGTVWGWLIGPFVDAYRKVHSDDERVRSILAEFQKRIEKGMLGQIAEIFDANAPYRSRGCAAQAWSVAELLRVSL